MKAIRIHGYGMAPVLEEVGTPDVRAGEVLVRVNAAALNPLDVKLHSGNMHGYFPLSFPYTMGTDLSGTVERVGAEVINWHIGDKVVARVDPTTGGALAEFVAVPISHLAHAPKAVSLGETAGVPTAAGTAWQALNDVANLKPGQTTLIHAGVGGVGSFAIQFARHIGARVIATASGAGITIARNLGADHVIDYRLEDFREALSDVDVIIDTIGGETQQRSYGVLRAGGILVATSSPPDEALAKAHNVRATFVFHQSDAGRLEKIVNLIDTGTLKVLVDRQVSMGAFSDAFAHQASGRARGKIIVNIV